MKIIKNPKKNTEEIKNKTMIQKQLYYIALSTSIYKLYYLGL